MTFLRRLLLWVENLDTEKFGDRTSLALAPSTETMP